MDSQGLQALKAAISLSNMGVKLLERSRPHDAVATMKEALFLIRTASPQNAKMASNGLEARITDSLQKASKCVAESYRVFDCNTIMCQAPSATIRVFLDSESPMAATEAASYYKNITRSLIFAIRIDDRLYTEESLLSMDVELEVATILSNLAAALRSFSTTKMCNNPEDRLEEAFQLLQLAHSILARKLPYLEVNKNDEIGTSRLLMVSMLVVQNLFMLCTELELPRVHRDNLWRQLCYLHQTYIALSGHPCWGLERNNAAPAA